MRISHKAIAKITRSKDYTTPLVKRKYKPPPWAEHKVEFKYDHGDVVGYKLHPSLYLAKPPKHEDVSRDLRRVRTKKLIRKREKQLRRSGQYDWDAMTPESFNKYVDTLLERFDNGMNEMEVDSVSSNFQQHIRTQIAKEEHRRFVSYSGLKDLSKAFLKREWRNFDLSLGYGQLKDEFEGMAFGVIGDERSVQIYSYKPYLDQEDDCGIMVFQYPTRRYPRVKKLHNLILTPQKFSESGPAYVARKWNLFRNSVLLTPLHIRDKCGYDMAKKFLEGVTDYGHQNLQDKYPNHGVEDLMINEV
jgi:hypothetical protein